MTKLIDYFAIYGCLIILILCCVEARLRYRIRTRPECRDKGPRRFEELPQVVVSGIVEQIYPSDGGDTYSGSVMIKRVFRGPNSLEGARVTVGGFGTQGLCFSNTKKWDSWIFLLNQVSEGFLTLNHTLLKMTLPNLDRMNALVKDEPYRRRSPIVDLECEKQYCENNGNCLEERSSYINRAKCVCLDYCPPNYNPVCGSNGETFSNECQIRQISCQRKHNYFIRFPNSCESGRNERDVVTHFLPHLSI